MKTTYCVHTYKRILPFALVILMALGITMQPLDGFAASGLNISTDAIGGNTANVVSVTLGGNRTADILVANQSIHTDQAVNAMINNAKSGGTVVAAVNGGFFNAYYNGGKTLAYPGNCAQVYATLVQNNCVINGGGKINAIGFDYNGKAFIDRVSIKPQVSVRGGAPSALWGVNKYSTDAGGIFLLNDMFDYAITIPVHSRAYVVKANRVVQEKSAGTHKVENGTQLLIYNGAAVENILKWNRMPAIGDTVSFDYEAEAQKAGTNENWENMKSVMGGGRMLVINGKNVASDSGYNATLDSDPKQSANNKSLRTFIAVMGDGTLLMGNANATFVNLADYLVKKGAKDAVCMDGGASTMLYADSKGMVTNAGRKLATVIAIVDKSRKDQKPTEYIDRPSSYFVETVQNAQDLGILPDEINAGYQSSITRMEFCQLIVKLIESIDGTVSKRLSARGIPFARVDEVNYSDTPNYSIKYCTALRLVSGYSNGTFKPHNLITRQEAAVILRNLSDIYDLAPTTITTPNFDDSMSIADWSRANVYFVASLGIMNGDGKNFDPLQNITREQAIATIMKVNTLIKQN